MTDMEAVPGWAAVVEWFGYAPNFHDAEVVSIDLRRDPARSAVGIHAWRTNSDTTDSGHFRQDRHALVTLTIGGIRSLKLDGWNHQNVLSELSVNREGGCYVLRLPEIFGVDGEIAATHLSLAIEPFEAR